MALDILQGFVTSVAPLEVTYPGADTAVPVELSGPYPQSVSNDDNGTLADVSTITGISKDAMTANTIYASVSSSGGWHVNFYKNAKRTVLIGHTAVFSADGEVTVSHDGEYSLGGTVTIDNYGTIAADTNISLAVTQYTPNEGDQVETVDRAPQKPLLRGKVK